MAKISLCFYISLFFLVSACTTFSVDARRDNAASIVKSHDLEPLSIQTSFFLLAGYSKVTNKNDIPVIYIEGDGFSWIDKYTISSNPTPKTATALKLASLDQSANVFYLARPCQYVDLKMEKHCAQKYWTDARFSSEIIQSYNEALDQLKMKSGNDGFHLVGFSGGAAVAVLLASQRKDIKSIRTVAGNLDHIALHRKRGVSQLTRSLDPLMVAKQINDIPQIHYSGGEDETVPAWVTQSFVKKAENPQCVKMRLIGNVSHSEGWEQLWRVFSAEKPECKQ